MKCELCAKELAPGKGECPECTSPEKHGQIQRLMSESVGDLAKKVKVEKGQGELLFMMANFHRLCGRYDEAVRYYEQAIEDVKPKPEYYRSLGTVLASKGDLHGAVAAMQKAVSLAPRYPDFRNDLGAAYFKNKQYDEAIREFQAAIELNPRYANAYNNLASVYRKKGMFAEAEINIRKAIDLDPQHAIASYDLGLSYYGGSMFSQLSKGLRIDAKSLGDLYAMRGMHPEAIANYRKALEVHPDYPDIHCALGAACEAAGDAENAKRSYRAALERNPNYREARARLTALEGGGGTS